MRHPLKPLVFFSSLVVAGIITIIFTLTFNGPVTENEVYASAGERDGFVFIGHIFHVDLDLWQMLVSWQPAGCGKYFARTEPSYALQNYGTGTNCGRPAVNGPSWSFDPAKDPFDGEQSILLNRLSPNGITYAGQQFIYPFDDYESRNTFVALTPSADGSSSNATFLPILNVAAVDAAETFVPSYNFLAPVPNARVKFDGAEIDKAYVFMLTVRRSRLAQAFTISIFVVNWGLVVCVMYITLVAWTSKDQKAGDWALAAPVTIILTIPGLRTLFVGNPPFGILFGKDAMP
ncbi:hypothetical protein B0H13DRAFT_1912907 [Mycena leptocephala]|nr:hypothetical protein B0H13DRAFT_1912907 [Mycena leptocephala]